MKVKSVTVDTTTHNRGVRSTRRTYKFSIEGREEPIKVVAEDRNQAERKLERIMERRKL